MRTTVVENYPGFSKGVDGFELMQEMQKQAERFETRVQLAASVGVVDFSQRPFCASEKRLSMSMPSFSSSNCFSMVTIYCRTQF